MKKIVSITLKLLIITVISAIALGAVNYITKEPIAEQLALAADEARQTAFPAAAGFEELNVEIPEDYAIIKNVYNALDADGNVIGITASMITKGFNSGMHLTVGIGADGLIQGVVVGDNTETPGLGAKATEDWFQEQYLSKTSPLTVVKASPGDNEIQAITSATITTKGVTEAVNTASQFYTEIVGGAQ